MSGISSAFIFPHPPIIIPEIGKGEESKAKATVEGCKTASDRIAMEKPDTILIITPHGPAFRDVVCVSSGQVLEGNFSNFGRADLKFRFENNTELVKNIIEEANISDRPIAELDNQFCARFRIDSSIDHGSLVPLYYVTKAYTNFRLVRICMGFLNYTELFEIGQCISRAIEKTSGKVVVIGSGDLSHRLTHDGPYEYSPKGIEFDTKLIELLKKGDFDSVMNMDPGLIEEAGECGMRPFAIMFGCLEGMKVQPKIFSYEGPFGIGYCVSEFNRR